MPREKLYASDAERVAAHRARKAEEALIDEQALRDELGYSPSETRTQAERAQVAARIAANFPAEVEQQAQAIWTAQGRTGLYSLTPAKSDAK